MRQVITLQASTLITNTNKSINTFNPSDVRVTAIAILCAINFTGCTITPLAIDNGEFYLGAFTKNKKEDKNCRYSEIEGIGLKFATSHFSAGVGYFEQKILIVVPGELENCSSEIADVYIGKMAEEKAKKTNIRLK